MQAKTVQVTIDLTLDDIAVLLAIRMSNGAEGITRQDAQDGIGELMAYACENSDLIDEDTLDIALAEAAVLFPELVN